ncbi:MAG TPA: SIS domain-containing protein [Actinomycetota bacterium]|nr:SIS domain-containing protein [Actinomycetota bacterium]
MKSLGKFPDPFIAEIAGQPDALRRAATAAIDHASVLGDAVGRARAGALVCTGMGSSYHAAHPAVTALAAAGVRASMVDAAELLHFRRPMLGADDVVVLVSQSGASAETVALADALRSAPVRPWTLAVTNAADGPLAGLVDEVIATRAGPETGPSTMTFGASVTVLAALARADTPGMATFADDVERAARAVERLLAADDLPDRLVGWHGGRATTVIVGRGGARATAEMAALTIEESVGLPVAALQAAQFRHGPLELAGPDLAAMIVSTEPSTAALDRGLGEDLRRLGSAVVLVGDASDAGPDAAVWVDTGPLDPALAPAAAIVPAQLLAWRLAHAAGRAPGAYVHASKVTTRE